MSTLLLFLFLLQAPAAPYPPPYTVPESVLTQRLKSEALKNEAPYQVILPENYEKSRERYPVLYLLHGLTGHYSDWVSRTNLAEYARRYKLIVVLPEGGNLMYVNSSLGREEDHIIKELIPAVDRAYRTIPLRRARAVAGLSMGGYGALLLGLKHPNLFAFAGSLSGALAIPQMTERKEVMEVFGPPESPLRKESDLWELLKAAKPPLPYFYLDCGTEDRLLESNRKFAEALRAAKVPYEYRELPGAHTWDYWDRQVQQLLRVMEPVLGL